MMDGGWWMVVGDDKRIERIEKIARNEASPASKGDWEHYMGGPNNIFLKSPSLAESNVPFSNPIRLGTNQLRKVDNGQVLGGPEMFEYCSMS
jgi:hypothetical protein